MALALSAPPVPAAQAGAQPSANACFDAAVAGQKLRNAGKLLAANEQFVACARPSCPDLVVQECGRWLTELEAAIPTVVFAARDPSGRDLADVHVVVDSGAPRSASDGQPYPLDPGPHELHFVREGQHEIVQPIVVRAGEKNRAVVVQFSGETPSSAATTTSGGSVPLGTWVFGAVGVAALGVFGYFGIRGLGDFEHRGCDTGCSASDKSDVNAEFRVADLALGVGLIALGVATVLYLTRPPAHRETATMLRLQF
jgi:hypothetical protein